MILPYGNCNRFLSKYSLLNPFATATSRLSQSAVLCDLPLLQLRAPDRYADELCGFFLRPLEVQTSLFGRPEVLLSLQRHRPCGCVPILYAALRVPRNESRQKERLGFLQRQQTERALSLSGMRHRR